MFINACGNIPQIAPDILQNVSQHGYTCCIHAIKFLLRFLTERVIQKISVKNFINYDGTARKKQRKILQKGAPKHLANPKSNDNNCFQYALTVALNYRNIKKDSQRVSKIKPFIDQYNWKEIDFPSEQKNWKEFEQNNKSIALNILFLPYNTEKIRLAYKSKYNFKRENQVISLMITDSKKWHYLAVKSLSALLREITSNHVGDFYCLNCFHSCSTKEKLKKHEKYVMIMIIVCRNT